MSTFLTFALAVLVGATAAGPAPAQTSAEPPAGATGLCRDGLYTFSKEKKNSCRGRQGIQVWFADSHDVEAPAPPAVTPIQTQISNTAPGKDRRILIVYMGGNDCPPCVAWRANDLPRLQATEAFRSVTFTYVQKTIQSPVPPAMFLPSDVKPYKDQLDAAGGGRGGSAQVAIVVDGELFDYYFGVRSAEEVEQMILAIRNGTKYPFERCLKRDAWKGCVVRGS
jgi:hypothetical protein